MEQTNDLNVVSTMALPSPKELKKAQPLTDAAALAVVRGRTEITNVLRKKDDRLLVITGPCSIHEPEAALDYARRLTALRCDLADRLCIVMRVYFEKPRTTIGWKGMIYDPFLDGSDQIDEGLKVARELLLKINEMGLPCATEFLDPVIPQYTAELVSWAAIGARTTESQTHREMCSGLSMPVGFKNSTDGNLQVAIDAMISAKHPHTFLGVDQEGVTSLVRTKGNPWSHIVLRGGRERPNYDEVSVAETCDALRAANQDRLIVVDCSHANSSKKHDLQGRVLNSVINQRLQGNDALVGVMIESNLGAGNQPLPKDLGQLEYGVSITDACMDWDTTESLLRDCHKRLEQPVRGMELA